MQFSMIRIDRSRRVIFVLMDFMQWSEVEVAPLGTMTSSPLFPNVIPRTRRGTPVFSEPAYLLSQSSLISNMTEKNENEAEELIDVMKHV